MVSQIEGARRMREARVGHNNVLNVTGLIALLFAVPSLYIYCASNLQRAGNPWQQATYPHLLGLDEFGRDLLSTAVVSSLNSLAYGLTFAAGALIMATLLAFVIAFSKLHLISLLVEGVSRVIEGVPIVMWVLLFGILAPTAPKSTSTIVFFFAVLPYLIRIIAGEFSRLRSMPFVEAARMQQLPSWLIAFRHLLPNTAEILGPAMAQIAGLAVAIDGAIAIVGSANRTDLSLGVLLLRGKENVLSHAHLMAVAITFMLASYGVIWFIGKWASGRTYISGRLI